MYCNQEINFFPKNGTTKKTKTISQKIGLLNNTISIIGSINEPNKSNPIPIKIKYTDILLKRFTTYINPFVTALKNLSKNFESPNINLPYIFFTLLSKFFF